MKHEERLSLIDAIIFLLETTYVKLGLILILSISCISKCHSYPLSSCVLYTICFVVGWTTCYLCLLQAAAEWHPHWLDLDQILEDHNMELHYTNLAECSKNPADGDFYTEYSVVSSDESDDNVYAAFVVDRRDGEVVGVLMSDPKDESRLLRFGPSAGLHPVFLIDSAHDGSPDIYIESELASILIKAIHGCKDNSQDKAMSDYFWENSYGGARRWRFFSPKRARKEFPSTFDHEDEELIENPR